MKVCFISNCPRIGGAERVLLETIDTLLDEGIECHVLLPGKGVFADELSRRGISYAVVRSASITLYGRPSLWQRLKASVRLCLATISAMREIVESKSDVVYSNTVTVGHGAIAAKLLAKSHIWHLQEFGWEDHGFHFYFGERPTCWTVGRLSATCIAVSNALAEKYKRYIPQSKLKVVYPAMNLELDCLPGAAPSAPTRSLRGQFGCITVGGQVEGKRQADAIKAFAYLTNEGIDATLTIVGGIESPRCRQEMNEIIREHRLEQIVQFAGEVRDARSLIQSSDVLLVCSRSEAFGRVTIEAMQAGKPVIGAAAGATPELVRDGQTGLIYKVADAEGLAEKIRYLYHHRDESRRLGENGKLWAQTLFTKQRYSCELMAVVHALRDSA